MKPTKKRTKLTLSEVETQMEVLTKEEIDTLRGGGNGTYGSPYTQDEYYALFNTNSFYGGYVAGWGYVNPDVRTLQEGQLVERIGGWSIDGVLNAGSGVGGAINASIGLNEKGEVIFFKVGASAGVSIGGSSSVGASHTLIVKP